MEGKAQPLRISIVIAILLILMAMNIIAGFVVPAILSGRLATAGREAKLELVVLEQRGDIEVKDQDALLDRMLREYVRLKAGKLFWGIPFWCNAAVLGGVTYLVRRQWRVDQSSPAR